MYFCCCCDHDCCAIHVRETCCSVSKAASAAGSGGGRGGGGGAYISVLEAADVSQIAAAAMVAADCASVDKHPGSGLALWLDSCGKVHPLFLLVYLVLVLQWLLL